MSKEMKVIMERWDRFLILENANEPKTWGDLGQNILLNIAAERFHKNWQILVKVWIQNRYWNIKKNF